MRREPKEIIKTYKETQSVVHTARILGIHRSTVYRWLTRARSPYPYGAPRYVTQGLARKSTRPKRVRSALTADDRCTIEQLRVAHGFTAEKIKHVGGIRASVSTIQRYLKRSGHIAPRTRHRRPTCQDTVHMHAKNVTTIGYLQMDVKYLTPELTRLPWTCFEYAVMDIYSRYKDAVILNHLDQDGAIASLIEMVRRMPFEPTFVQTDNGLEFQSRFLTQCRALGLKHHYIHKSSPNENAVIERSFRTDEEEFIYYKAPFSDYDDLRQQYTEWLHWYNHERPHLGIDLLTPIAKIKTVANVLND